MKLRFETLMHTPYRFTDKLTIYLANWIKKKQIINIKGPNSSILDIFGNKVF